MKRAFTLLETLAAVMLLGMIATLIVAMFNQSSLAWRAGRASQLRLDERRQRLAAESRLAANALVVAAGDASADTVYQVESPWNEQGELRRERPLALMRGFTVEPGNALHPLTLTAASTPAMAQLVVGVTSAGPDGKFGTADDLTSWPLGVSE